MITVYIAGPYTSPDPCENTNRAIKMADQLLARGFAPFVPHLSHFWHTVSPKPYQTWIDYDLEWVKRCDCVLRLCGESKGADGEVALAESIGIPVFETVAM